MTEFQRLALLEGLTRLNLAAELAHAAYTQMFRQQEPEALGMMSAQYERDLLRIKNELSGLADLITKLVMEGVS